MSLTINDLITRLNTSEESIEFNEVMHVISNNYNYQQSSFTNGDLVNQAGTNEGSCKIFAFAKLNDLSEQATLNCFGQYYHNDVLNHPTAEDHGNIRNFIKFGWSGIAFDNDVLTIKS